MELMPFQLSIHRHHLCAVCFIIFFLSEIEWMKNYHLLSINDCNILFIPATWIIMSSKSDRRSFSQGKMENMPLSHFFLQICNRNKSLTIIPFDTVSWAVAQIQRLTMRVQALLTSTFSNSPLTFSLKLLNSLSPFFTECLKSWTAHAYREEGILKGDVVLSFFSLLQGKLQRRHTRDCLHPGLFLTETVL